MLLSLSLRLALWQHALDVDTMPPTVRVLSKLAFCTNQSSLCLLSILGRATRLESHL